jgi:GNAT superfamily N-acetyltransferase
LLVYAREELIEQMGTEKACELERLVKTQWDETATYRHPAVAYNPNFHGILDSNNRGDYRVIVLYNDHHEIIGYLFFFVNVSLHTSRIVATHDIFFVRKDYRFGRGALMLLDAVEKSCRAIGVTELYAGHAGGQPMLRLMEKMGYTTVGHQFYKSLVDARGVQ